MNGVERNLFNNAIKEILISFRIDPYCVSKEESISDRIVESPGKQSQLACQPCVESRSLHAKADDDRAELSQFIYFSPSNDQQHDPAAI